MQALKASYDKDLASRDEQGEEGRKSLLRQVNLLLPNAHMYAPAYCVLLVLPFILQLHDLEAQVDEERKMRSSATSGRKKLENELADLHAQLDLEVKAKEDALKTYRKTQVCSLCSAAVSVFESYANQIVLWNQL